MTHETTAPVQSLVDEMVQCICGDEYPAGSYGAGFIHGSGMCENCDAAIPAKDVAPVAVLDGWKPVPERPTIEMVEAGYEVSLGEPDRSGRARVFDQYKAMLAAAPTPPAQQSQWAQIHQVRYLLSGNTDWQDSDSARKEWCETENAKNAAEGRQVRWETRTLYRQASCGDTAAPEIARHQLSAEDLAHVREAAKEGLLATTLPSGAVAFLNDGAEPDYSHLNCPACGGSGHIDDVQDAAPEQAEQPTVTVPRELLTNLIEALQVADQFIRNGIELGYISMPEHNTPDPAHTTPAIVQGALSYAKDYFGDTKC